MKRALLLALCCAMCLTLDATAASRYWTGSAGDGALGVTGAVSEDTVKTNVTAAVSAGATTLTVGSNAGFAPNDLALIIQVRGAGAGAYEFVRVAGTAATTTIFTSALANAYLAAGAQIIKVKEYSQVTVNSGGTWKASAWNGTTGGVLAAVIRGSMTVNGTIDVSGLGYAGAPTSTNFNSFQGEGYPAAGGSPGSAANGNGAGGGSIKSGCANPPSGGGGGGNANAGSNGVLGTGGTPGTGGSAVGVADLSTALFMGGGGGGGGSNQSGPGVGGGGGAGGGIAILVVGGDVKITGSVKSDGAPGATATGSCQTAGGGGGAGGSIRILSTGTVDFASGVLQASAGPAGPGIGGGVSGGAGSVGRIALISVSTPSGTASPPADSSSPDLPTPDYPYAGPVSVTDLKVEKVIGGFDQANISVLLSWTAPGDSLGAGGYENFSGGTFSIRYQAGSAITSDAIFNAAAGVLDISTSGVIPGTRRYALVSPLSPASDYYFAIKATSSWALTSGLSNSPKTTGYISILPSSTGNTWGIALGDIDNDRDLDIVLANGNGTAQTQYTLGNDGKGNFSSGAIEGTLRDHSGVAMADFDNDGDIDILEGKGSNFILYRNSGVSPVVVPQTMTGCGTLQASGIVAGDFDNDGDVDAVASYESPGAPLCYMTNDGKGNFSASTIAGSSFRSGGLAVGDFDQDGDLDVLLAVDETATTANNARLVRNDGGGRFTVMGILPGTAYFARGGSFGDLDGDGDLDLVVALTGSTNDAVYENVNGAMTFKTTLTGAGNTDAAVLADSDGDGDLDVLTTAHNGGAQLYYRNDGNFSFSQTTLASLGDTYEAKWGDLDGDGDPDAVVANLTGGADEMYRNDSPVVNAAPTAVSLNASDIVFKYGPKYSTMTFKWDGGLYDGTNSSGPLNFIVAVATSPLTVSGDQLYITDPSTFSATNKHFIVSPAVGSPLTGQYPRPAFKTWPGDSTPKHGILISTAAGTGADTFRTGTYYFRVQVMDAGLRRGPWSNEVSIALSAADFCQNGTVTSIASGNGSNGAIWDTGIPPDRCSDVVIAAGHTVLMDGQNAEVKSMTINGTLQFTRAFSSTMTVTGGDLTIANGGTLDMGTEVDPIPIGSTATLVLAYGASAGQYGLIVQDGGTFTVNGAAKTPFGFSLTSFVNVTSAFDIAPSSAVNWAPGDRLALLGRDSNGGGPAVTTVVTVTGISQAGGRVTVTFSPSSGQTRTVTPDTPVLVANLSRNAVIRSSGTDNAANTSYIRNLSQNAAGFRLANAEVDDMGTNASGKYGVTFDGAFVKGFISSSVFSAAQEGVTFTQAQGNVLESSVFLGNAGGGAPVRFGGANNTLRNSVVARSYADGLAVQSSGTIVTGSHVSATSNQGLYVTGSQLQLIDSKVFNTGSFGVYFQSGATGSLIERSDLFHINTAMIAQNVSSVTVMSSRLFSNSVALYHAGAQTPFYVDNEFFANGVSAFGGSAGANPVRDAVLAENYFYSNAKAIDLVGFTSRTVVMGGALGYDRMGNNLKDTTAEVAFTSGKADGITLKGVRVNPAGAVDTMQLDVPGGYIAAYNSTFATGTVAVNGDFSIAQATLSLVTAKALYPSGASGAVLYRGNGHALTVTATSDIFAKTQLITFQFRGSKWHVDGTDGGGQDLVASFNGSVAGLGIPSVNSQVQVNFTEGPAPVEGDRIGFLLTAASPDAGVQKRLTFGGMGPLPGYPSKLTIGPNAGFEAVGAPGAHAIIDASLAAGSTYFKMLSSGTFTVKYASFTNMHGDGIWLAGNKGVTIEDTVFDKPGFVNQKNFFLTASDLTSSTQLARVTFDQTATAPAGAFTTYNVRALGGVSNLRWTFPQPSNGTYWGSSFEDDPVPNHIAWMDCSALSSWASGAWSDPAVWDGGYPPTSCNGVNISPNDVVTVDISSAVASTTTVLGRLSFSRVVPSTLTIVTGDLSVNGGGILDMGTGASPILSSATLVLSPPTGGVRRGLSIAAGGVFTAHGTTRTPFGFASESISAGQSYFKISASSAVGWSDGDLVAVGATAGTGPSGVDFRRINSITGTDPLIVNVTPVLGAARVWTATAPIVVANLSRNVLVRSTGTAYASDTAYVLSYATTPFSAHQTEFAFIGGSGMGVPANHAGVRAEGAFAISSAAVHDGVWGFDQVGMGTMTATALVGNLAGMKFGSNGGEEAIFDSVLMGNQSKGAVGAPGAADRTLLAGCFVCSNGSIGVDSPGTASRLLGNTVCLNASSGINAAAGDSEVFLSGNKVYGNSGNGLDISGGTFLVESNTVSGNGGSGIVVTGASSQVSSNTSAGNSGFGFYLSSGSHLLFSNRAYSNSQSGFGVSGTTATFVDNYSYSNTGFGFDVRSGTIAWFGGAVGRDPALAPAGDGLGAFGAGSGGGFKRLSLGHAWVNGLVDMSNFTQPGENYFSVNQDRDTGTVRIHGDMANIAGFSFAYSAHSYPAFAQNALLLRGTGHSASASSLSDANAVSQIITIERRGGAWHVDGSVTGPDLVAAFGGNTAGLPVPGAGTQFSLTFFQGGAPQEGDRVAFILGASAQNAGVQKRLLFGDGNPGVNNGRSRLRTASSLLFRGNPGFPTVVDRLSGSSTYYTLVASGPFTAENSSFSNVDGDGLQLFQSGSVIYLATTTFDSMGFTSANNAYINIVSNGLGGSATFYALEFGNSRSTASAASASNIRMSGAGPHPNWVMRKWRGAMGGEAYDGDALGDELQWAPFTPESAVSTYTAVSTGTISLQWLPGSNDEDIFYWIQTSSAPNFTTVLASSRPVYALTGTVSGLQPNTSYYVRVVAANQWGATVNESAFKQLQLGATATLALAPSTTPAGQFGIWETSSVWGWVAGPAVPLSSTTYGYILEASSTSFDGTGAVYSSSTLSNFVSTLTVGGPGGILERNTTYYFRVGSLNEFGAPNYTTLGSSPTLALAVAPGAFGPVFSSSATLSWAPLAASPQPNSAEGYLLEASSTDFGGQSPGGVVYSSRTPAVGASGLELSSLSPQTTYYFRVGTLNWAGVPNYVSAGSTVTGGDVIAPRALTDLSIATAALSGALVDLQWAAPGDDDDYNVLAGAEYRVQYASYTVGFATGSAQVIFSTGGVTPGERQFTRITGLQGGSTYYFRAWARDDAGNWSDLSNGATVYLSWTLGSVGAGSKQVSAAVGPDGKHHVFYNDGGNNLIHASRLSGQPWSTETAASGATETGVRSAAVVDASGTIHVALAYGTPAGNLGYTSWDGSWGSVWLVDGSAAAIDAVSMAVDGAGAVHVAYTRAGTLFYSRRSPSGVWATSNLGGAQAGGGASLKLRPDGSPLILYANASAKLRLLDWEGSGFTPRVIDDAASNQQAVGLVYDRDGLTAAAFKNAVDNTIRIDTAPAPSGPWSPALVLQAGAGNPYLAFDLDGSGSGELLYFENSAAASLTGAGDLRRVRIGDGFIDELVGSGGGLGDNAQFPALFMDLSGTVHAAYASAAGGPIVVSSSAFVAGPPVAAEAPGGFGASAVYQTSVTWGWSDRASAEEGYRVYGGTAAPYALVASTSALGPGSVSYTEAGLLANATYFRYAVVVTSGGASPSVGVTTVTLAQVPGPAVSTFTAVSTDSITAAWSGGANAPGTVYEFNASTLAFPNALPTNILVSTVPEGAPALAVSVLANTTYFMRVRTIARDGTPTAYWVLGSTVTPIETPTETLVDVVSSTTLLLRATATPSGFTNISTGAAGVNFALDGSFLGWVTGSSVTLLSGLTPNTSYTIRAKARNLDAVETATTPTVSTYTLAAVPSTATPTFPNTFVSSVALQWTHNGNPGPTEYRVIVSTAFDFSGASDSSTAWLTGTSTEPASLTPNTTLYFKVQARNANGAETSYADLGSTVTRAAQPGAAATAFSPIGQSSVTVSWLLGGNPAGTEFTVKASTASDFSGTVLSVGWLSALTTTFVGLPPDTTYYWTVGARNHAGQVSQLLSYGAQATLTFPPTASTEPFHAVWVTSANVQWAANGNSTDTQYQAEASTDPAYGTSFKSGWVTFLSTTVTGLTGDATYFWRVRSRGAAGIPVDYLALGSPAMGAASPVLPRLLSVGPASVSVEWGTGGNRAGTAPASWSTSTPLPAARERHGAVLLNGRVYVVGGIVSGSASAEVWSAPAIQSGGVGSWTRHADLPAPRESHALVAEGGRLYVLGGFDGVAKNTVFWAPVSPDGAVGAWRSDRQLPAARFKMAAVADGGWLYAIGGDNGVISQSTVYAAPLALDGSIGPWTTATALPSARNSHAAAVSEGFVYVSGGLGAGLSGTVWSAALAGASVGPWTAQASLGTPVFRHALLALPGRLVAVGGHDGNAAVATLQQSELLGAGTAGPWGTYAAMPLVRFGHGAVMVGRDIVVTGGSDGSIAVADTFDARLRGTEYQVEYAQDAGYTVAYGSTNWRAGAAEELSGLIPNTTYYSRIRVRTQAGVPGAFVDAPSTVTLAAVPGTAGSTFTAVFEGSMTVTWAANGNPAGTEFIAGLSTSSDFTTTFLSGWGTSVSSTIFGLSPNTTYFAAAAARNKAGVDSTALPLGSTMTLAAVPQDSSFTAVGGFGFTAVWSTAANPGGTRYEAEIALSNGFSPLAASSVTQNSSAQFLGLLGSSTYYLRVRALNGLGAPSAYSATTWTTTGLDISSPAVVGNLEAHPSESAGTLLALWTSPGDDGSSGDLQPGSRFYLQWAAGDPASVAWSTANAQLSVSTGPLAAGSSASMLVPGLPVGSNVALRVWTLDDGGMVSDPSAVVTSWVSPFDLSRLDGTGTDAGRGVSLALDRSGGAHASYTAGTLIQELRYMKRTGGVWSVPEGPDPGVPAADTVVAVDWGGVPQVLYRNAQTGQLRHARRSGAWSVSAVASGNLVPGGLALDATGQARITYFDAAAGDLLYAAWDGSAWQSETVDSVGDVGRTSSLSLDAGGTPHVAYFDATNGDLKFASRTAPGVWAVSTVDPSAAVVGSAPALALDGIGGAYVAYLDQGAADLKVARYDGASWSLSVVDGLSTAAAVGGIALDGAGNPLVSYYDGSKGDLLFARYNGTSWSTGTVDSRGDQGASSTVSVDAGGEVQVLHYNAASADLMSARWAAALSVPYGGNARGRLQAPANLAGIVASSTTIQWTWTDSAASELGWSLYGSLYSTGPYTLVAATTAIPATAGTGTNRSYSESGLAMGTTYYRYVVAVASGGYAASAVASTSPFITADVDTPVITDFQGDDTVWRRAAGALYNVDFTDTGGSLLSSFQVRASTVPNGAGPVWVDFTDVAGSILSDSYSANWALPAPFFAAMADGVTNYISVRVFDGAGNSSVSTDTFSVLKDTTPPAFQDLQGGDPARRSAGGTLYDVDAVDRASGLERFQYSVSLTPTAGDAAVVAWTDIPLNAGATDYTGDWGVSFAGLVEDATNYVSVRAWDMAGSTAVLNDVFFVVKDTAGPRVGFTLPASAFRSVLTQLSGTAADAAGVGGVQVAVQTAPIAGLWWDGAAFNSAVPVWLAASGTASWTFAAVPAWTDGGSFRLVARASDTLGNFSAPYSTADFTFDASSPTVGVTTPLDASTIAALPAISGTALDPGGAPSGLSLIEVRLNRLSDGLYWNWTAGGWTSSPIATTPVLGSPWTVAVPEALRSNLTHNASYFISVRAVDGATPVNTGSFSVGSTFTWTDTTPPAALTNLTGLSGPEPGEVSLAWTAPGEDGALGDFVLGQYRIHYSTDAAAAFSTAAAQVAFSTGGVVPGAYQGRLVSGLLAGSTYHLRVFMADDSGNWSALSNGATVVATPQPYNKITGQVMKVSSEGITAVLLEAYDSAGVRASSAYSLADGSGTFALDNILPGVYRVQASWTAGEVTSSVWLDNIAVGSYGLQFVLEVNYTLSSLTGTLASLSAQSAAPSGFLTRASDGDFQESRVQLLRGGNQVAEVKPDPTGRWTIPNLLPGKYAVRAFNGLEFSDALPVELGEGETQEVSFVFDPLPEAQAFAFPNPARDHTTMRFVSGLPGLEAQVSIFDIAGVLVKEIPGSAMTAKPGGLYHANWDLTNDNGESVASGVYLFMVKVRGSNGQIGKVIKKLAIVR